MLLLDFLAASADFSPAGYISSRFNLLHLSLLPARKIAARQNDLACERNCSSGLDVPMLGIGA